MLCFGLSACGDDGAVLYAVDGESEAFYTPSSSVAETPDSTVSDDETESDSIDKVCVFVCGHVSSPGVYELDEGSRICDALELAGGITDDGRSEAVEQAKKITDGQTIYVPGIDEEWDSGSAGSGTSDEGGSDASDGSININTSSKEELMSLPGIGESKASDIINYREEHGYFKSIEELKNIQGIKDGIFNKIKDMIRI